MVLRIKPVMETTHFLPLISMTHAKFAKFAQISLFVYHQIKTAIVPPTP